jgi:predicted amino acid-binding ACT domain protein
MEGCRLILAVFGPDGLCWPGTNPRHIVLGEARYPVGSQAHADLTTRVHELLARNGVRVLKVDTAEQGTCFTLILSAEVDNCSAQTLSELRRRLEAEARPLGVRIRVQREEIFAYMHRI